MSDDNRTGLSDIIDLMEKADEVLDRNEDLIDSVTSMAGSNSDVNLGEKEPLTELHKDEDRVRLVLEEKEEPSGVDIRREVENSETFLYVGVSERNYKAKVPGDIDMDTLSVTYKNGVLDVEVERSQPQHRQVEVVDETDSEGDDSDTEDT